MIINDILHILFRRVPPEKVIKNWLDSWSGSLCYEAISSLSCEENRIINALQNEYGHYTVDEAQYAVRYAKEYELSGLGNAECFGVFGLVAKSVENILTTDQYNECLCEDKEILAFRNLTHTIDPTIFVAAFLARFDIEHHFTRNVFSWNPIIRSSDPELQHVLNKGMAENHFHIGGSSNAFLFSWICLTNHFTPDRKSEFDMDREALDTVYASVPFGQESNYLLTFKAVCIRYFLFMRLHKLVLDEEDDSRTINEKWLKRVLSLTEEDCIVEMSSVNEYLETMRRCCAPTDDSGFIPDYALAYEPIHSQADDFIGQDLRAVRNYERRLYRPLAGEQRFQYDMFYAIFNKDKSIEPYKDLFYAYLLIYCRIRGELIQANSRIGFGNFSKYQDRKESFTARYPEYENMRTGIAERVVLENPQIVSLEGRFVPADTTEKFIAKVERLVNLGTRSICGVSDFRDGIQGFGFSYHKEQELRDKLRFVIHFPKKAQPIRNNETIELITPRDNIVRNKAMEQANAFIQARELRPDIMGLIKGVDACSSEIDCRPEVFACAIRKICLTRCEKNPAYDTSLPIMRVTYHAGEDFLDPLDGLHAIDEAIQFCQMKSGDRLGHALALGIDCEKWYAQKGFSVLMHAQELLDNLVWLYGAMRRYGVENKIAENEIIKQFNVLYPYIYSPSNDSLHSINIEQYYSSLLLRGNDPALYLFNPQLEHDKFEQCWDLTEPWQVIGTPQISNDIIPDLLFHCYHYDYEMKKRSERIEHYSVHRTIVEAVAAVQKKMQYDVAQKNISIECNPSSNFLIGTFKDYLEHPIFSFNNKYLLVPGKETENNPHINASINTDDLGVFDTSLENEFAIMVSALEKYNEYVSDKKRIPRDSIFGWIDNIREIGIKQIF